MQSVHRKFECSSCPGVLDTTLCVKVIFMLEFKQRVIDTFLNEAFSFLRNRQNVISILINMMTITCNFIYVDQLIICLSHLLVDIAYMHIV